MSSSLGVLGQRNVFTAEHATDAILALFPSHVTRGIGVVDGREKGEVYRCIMNQLVPQPTLTHSPSLTHANTHSPSLTHALTLSHTHTLTHTHISHSLPVCDMFAELMK